MKATANSMTGPRIRYRIQLPVIGLNCARVLFFDGLAPNKSEEDQVAKTE